MKIAVLGGGGFRVPMVFGALLARRAALGLDEVALYEPERDRLDRIGLVLEGLRREAGSDLRATPATDLDAALEGADFVFSAIRVGGLEGRLVDERVALAEGVVGQETTGPGGIAFALRTVPVMRAIAERVASVAPGAWLINFTNPAGLVTEALTDVLGDRVLGICDSPVALAGRLAGVLGRCPGDVDVDYAGLNHLGWVTAVRDGGVDRLPGILADDGLLGSFLEGRLFGAEWLRTIGVVPNEYLYFYYFGTDALAALGSGVEPRGSFLLRQQAAFYGAADETPEAALATWRAARRERETSYFAEARAPSAAGAGRTDDQAGQAGQAARGTVEAGDAAAAGDDEGGEGYEGMALAAIEAIALDRRATLILNVPNRGALPFLDDAAVVEVPCVIGRAGARPLVARALPSHARLLVETVKQVERLAIRAALERSRPLAVEALALHPLVPSVTVARRLVDGYAAGHPELAWAA